MRWNDRVFGRSECAEKIGITPGHLDVLIHRMKGIEVLFSGKEGRNRVFSLKDIAVLKVAHLLERFGESWLFAVSDAFERLEHPPPEDAVLISTMGRSMPQPRRVISDRDVPRLPVDETTLLVPIGSIVASIIKETPVVAVH